MNDAANVLHARTGAGTVEIEHGGLAGPFLRMLAGLPNVATCDVAVSFDRNVWDRRYRAGRKRTQRITTVDRITGGFVERFGPVVLHFAHTSPTAASITAVTFFGFGLPKPMLQGDVEVLPLHTRTHTSVSIRAGRLGWLRYRALTVNKGDR